MKTTGEGARETVMTTQHYWYADDDERTRSIEVLEAMRSYRAAEAAMEQRTQTSMKMGETDLSALRYLLRAQRDQRTVGPKELGGYLGISSASTTVLIDRLEKAGHLSRQPSPFDRRALILVPSASSDDEVREILGDMHERMVRIAQDLTPEEADVVVTFLTEMQDAVDSIDAPTEAHEMASQSSTAQGSTRDE